MEAELSGNPEDNVSAFQITLGPGFFLADDGYHTIDGLKLGLLASGGDGVVNGVEAAPFSSSTSTVRGLQASVCANFARCMEGVQFGLVNLVGEASSFPVQFGIVNHARGEAVQFGIVNLLPDSQFPFIPFFNIN